MNQIKEFENRGIRMQWDEEKEEYYFSVVDVVGVLTDQPDTRHAAKYWSVVKTRLKKEGSELTTICSQLKMKAADGKSYKTDVATQEQLLRIIQSVPSPKAEPLKLWLARVGSERIDEMIDPEQAIDRAINYYRRKGESDDWIQQRMVSIRARNELTDEWKNKGVEGNQYAILTDEVTRAWTGGMSTRDYKNLKGLKKENLRDNMTTTELVLNMLAEVSTKNISQTEEPETFEENKAVARKGGKIAGDARKALEAQTGKRVVTKENAEDRRRLLSNTIDAVSNLPKPENK